MPTIRILTYNVRSMRDDRAALGRVISSVEPDVVAVQEAPRFLRWRSLCGQLARRSGMVVVGGGRPAAANLILSTLAVDKLASVDVLFSKDRGLHQRGTAIAVLAYRGAKFAIAGTHLDGADTRGDAPRLRHVAELNAAIYRHVPAGVPVIVAGDMNCHPGSASWLALQDQRQDAFAVAGVGNEWTSTATAPHQRIDGLFVDRRLTVLKAEVVQDGDTAIASDHLPVLVEIELPE
jgi:endonuclease/exonuclease/phosphatase family metal-dependent hydrolase